MTDWKATFTLAWTVVAISAALVSLPGSLELLLLIFGSLLPRRKDRGNNLGGESKPWRVAVIIPAHNEEANIARSLESLASAICFDFSVDIVVVADNCVDQTAANAARRGARVLVRHDETRRGKGHALHFAFRALHAESYDAFLVVDADTEVAPDFLLRTIQMFRSGADAVQARYLLLNPDDSIRTRLTSVANRAFNVLRARGRDRLGLSCGVYGNGFGMTRETLAAVPYLASSIVEDLEYHLALVRAGKKIRFVETTSVYAETPSASRAASSQRTRWEGGRLRMIREKTPGLLNDVLHLRRACVEPLLDLLLLPLAFHVMLLLVAASTPLPSIRILGIGGLALVILHLLIAIAIGDGTPREAMALLAAPLYVIWKMFMIPALARGSRADTHWVRTERNVERSVESR